MANVEIDGVNSIVYTDKLDPKTGTGLELGTSGDTVSLPSGATLDISASTLTPPATMPASSAANLTNIPGANITGTIAAVSGANLTSLTATNLGSGTVPTARLGSGTASSTTVLYGDQTYKTEPGGALVYLAGAASTVNVSTLDFNNFATDDYLIYKIIGRIIPNASAASLRCRFKNSTTASTGSEYKSIAQSIYTNSSTVTEDGAFYGWDQSSFFLYSDSWTGIETAFDLTYIPQNDTIGIENYSSLTGTLGGGNGSADYIGVANVWGTYEADQVHNGFQFFFNGWDIDSYNVKIYGMKVS